jgi:hypothetical protein
MTYVPGLSNESMVSSGAFRFDVPAATSGVVIKNGPGRLCRAVVITTMLTTPLTFYDNASGTATGPVLGVIPNNATAGTIFDFEEPANVGISAVGGTGQTAMPVTFD